jgi:hypothetical protein
LFLPGRRLCRAGHGCAAAIAVDAEVIDASSPSLCWIEYDHGLRRVVEEVSRDLAARS